MTQSTGPQFTGLLGSAVVAVAMTIAGAANASLLIQPNGGEIDHATFETQVAGGPGFPCGAVGCTPQVTTFGYEDGARLIAVDTGWYQFTYEGAGNAGNTNKFTAPGGSFTNNPSSVIGSTFSEFLTAGSPITFGLTGTQSGCSLTSGSASTQLGCDYLIALQNSPTSPAYTGTGGGGSLDVGPQRTAFIGLSDGLLTTDTDFQDLVVRVDQIPEPATLGLMITGLLGLARIRGRRRTV